MQVLLYLVSAAIAFVVVRWALHLLRLSRHRGIGRDDFLSRFQTSPQVQTIAGAVYDYFKKQTGVGGFEPLPSDTLKTTYRIGGDDLEEVLADIAHRLGYEMPHSGILSMWFDPIDNLEDVVRFLDWVRTQHGPAAP